MTGKRIALFAALFTLTLFVSLARADDKAKTDKAADQAAADAYMKATQPGPEHERLKKFAGDWEADVKAFNPDGSAQGNSKGVMHAEMILGGRYLQLSYSGEMDMGDHKMPFKGVGLGGYDNGQKKYVNVWVDEMSTGIMTTEGTYAGDTLTCEGTSTEPMSGQPMKVKEVITEIDAKHHKYELHMMGADG